MKIFNPSHDECLASGLPYFTPSLTARQMDEVRLPGWCTLSELDAPSCWQQLGASAQPEGGAAHLLEVWGWDARIVQQLRKRGCPEVLLPTDEQLATIRQLSSRQTAVKLLPLLTNQFKNWWCESIEEVEALPEGAKLYKSPWSCSGRGVFAYNRSRIMKVIREQGGIEVEPLYDRVADFAMEFRCAAGEVEFLGYSAMMNGQSYGGNLVATDAEILSLMTAFVPEQDVLSVRDSLVNVLRTHIAPYYSGPLGVDQMIVRRTNGGGCGNLQALGGYLLHPLVEINLRHTMGHLAIELRGRE